MRYSIFSAAAMLAAAVRAIQVSAPTKDQVIDLSSGFEVTWATVSSDTSKAHLYLVNQAGGHTPYSKDLGEVDLKKGKFTVTLKGVPDDTGYQFNIQSVQELNTGILAQSPQFEVKASSKTSSSTSSSASSTTSSSDSESSESSTSFVLSTRSASNSAATTTAAPTGTGTGATNGTKTSASTTASQTGAAPANRAAGGSLLALAIGLVAVIA
ncbi:hypothetical protein B0H67DRAFT_648884 [Lasiosphaeris hirsuta]|uniref:Yeast cell wall synthesis Kre9/Knh1-like N-terminal domain-containing protein n=1 Tax=Lasiosphaeris hirsuta TaxID=260670 RepID=A0AA40DLQ6_9PEZI|nr:hypothetical protein B0H67DRAFT_648884 [Lasiosphaeris hirsuta]